MTIDQDTYYYLFNHHGDIMGLTDSTGNVVASYTYDAWGNILSQTGPVASVNPYRYAGYRYDENTKLYYLMARYYNPENGVFLSIDPVRGELSNPVTQNGYNYANNNPVMMVDPGGSFAQVIVPVLIYGGLLLSVYLALPETQAKLSDLISKAANTINKKFNKYFYLNSSNKRHIRDRHVLPYAEGEISSKFPTNWDLTFIYRIAETIANSRSPILQDAKYLGSASVYRLGIVYYKGYLAILKVPFNYKNGLISSA